MKAQTLILALALTALCGCVAVKQPEKAVTMPPLPPGAPVPTKAVAKARTMKAASLSTIKAASVEPEVWTVDKLYIQQRTNGLYLCWLTNGMKSVMLSTTNLTTPMIQWDVFSTYGKVTNDSIISLQITNRTAPMRFYRLLSVPTNSIVFSWTYPFTNEPTVDSFKLYEGQASRSYSGSKLIVGKTIWNVHQVVSSNRLFYSITAQESNTGLESDFSNEVGFQPGDTNRYSIPAP